MQPSILHFAILLALTSSLFIVVGGFLIPARGRATLVVALMLFLLGTASLFFIIHQGARAATIEVPAHRAGDVLEVRGVPCFSYRRYRPGIRCTL